MLLPKAPVRATPAASSPAASDLANIQHAIAEAQLGLSEGGVPIGACLVNTKTGEVIGSGRNRRVQMGSATRHGETDCLERIGRLPAKVYRECTMYTTLSPWKASVLSSLPCQITMCTGACILYGIPRVVMGENETFVGGEAILADHGVEVVNLNLPECKALMQQFIKTRPDVWWEDIGENDDPSTSIETSAKATPTATATATAQAPKPVPS